MRGATSSKDAESKEGSISIHAPHAGSDNHQDVNFLGGGISIHAPHAGSDLQPG